MSDAIVAAIIGATSAILVMVAKDLVAPHLLARKKKRQDVLDLYRRYAQPLALASVSLFYRLREILVDTRYSFLLAATPSTDFNRYKFLSTIYRLASVVGWIRALKREQSLLLQPHKGIESATFRALWSFENVLADGPHVEDIILEKLMNLWDIETAAEKKSLRRVAQNLDALRQHAIAEITTPNRPAEITGEMRSNSPNFSSLPAERRLAFVTEASVLIAEGLGLASPTPSVLSETLERSSEIFSVTQTWIYRDWQSTIGDLMLNKVTSPVRQFDVIGFGDFESLYAAGNPYMLRLKGLFYDLHVERTPIMDFRVRQLRDILKATCQILIEINKLEFEERLIGEDTIQQAQIVLQQHQ